MNNHQVEEAESPALDTIADAHIDMLLDSFFPGAGLLFEFFQIGAETGAPVPELAVRLEIAPTIITDDPPQNWRRLRRRR